MIDIENAKQEFLEYTGKFDISNINIERKREHSLRVMQISKTIAENLKLSNEQIKLATLIGLLHDIGRFEQYKKYESFKDHETIDHGALGVEILKKDEYIKKYIENEKYYDVILKAIYNHNKYKIEDGVNSEEDIFCKIIRDADKLDIFYEEIEMFSLNKKDKMSESFVSEAVMQQFLNYKQVENTTIKTIADIVIRTISFIYDINYKESLKIVKEKDYINKIIDNYQYNEKTKKQMEHIRNIENAYIDEKIK